MKVLDREPETLVTSWRCTVCGGQGDTWTAANISLMVLVRMLRDAHDRLASRCAAQWSSQLVVTLRDRER